MKKNLVRLAALFAALGGVFTQGRLWAQVVSVNVPFAFRAGDTLLPAGKYVIQTNHANNSIVIQGERQDARIRVATFASEKLDAPTAGTLVFHRYGENYFLWQVWNANYVQGRELPKSAAEKEVARAGGVEIASLRAGSR